MMCNFPQHSITKLMERIKQCWEVVARSFEDSHTCIEHIHISEKKRTRIEVRTGQMRTAWPKTQLAYHTLSTIPSNSCGNPKVLESWKRLKGRGYVSWIRWEHRLPPQMKTAWREHKLHTMRWTVPTIPNNNCRNPTVLEAWGMSTRSADWHDTALNNSTWRTDIMSMETHVHSTHLTQWTSHRTDVNCLAWSTIWYHQTIACT